MTRYQIEEINAWIDSIRQSPIRKSYDGESCIPSPTNIATNIATNNKKENRPMPKIINYMYDDIQKATILTWSDGTKTVAKCENNDKPSLYDGFMICVAKKFMPNATSQANEWIVKKPKREAAAKAKAKAEQEEAERIAAKKAEKAKRWNLRKQAGLIAEAYKNQQEREEIKKIATEKYNVPSDFVEMFFE